MNRSVRNRTALFPILLIGVLITLAACEPASEPHNRTHHDHGALQKAGDHPQGTAEPDHTTLDAIASERAGHTLPFFDSESFTPIWLEPGSPELEGFHHIPEFEFVNQDGQLVSSEGYEDTIYVATFFFATCPGICSALNERILTIQDAISGLADVRILSHTITPEIDTVEVLRSYANEKGINSSTWDLVTGDRDKIYAVAKDGYFASEDMGKIEAMGDFKHTENILLIDKDGRIRGIYNGLSRNAMLNVVADIELLREEQPQT